MCFLSLGQMRRGAAEQLSGSAHHKESSFNALFPSVGLAQASCVSWLFIRSDSELPLMLRMNAPPVPPFILHFPTLVSQSPSVYTSSTKFFMRLLCQVLKVNYSK